MATQYAFGKIVTDGLVFALDASDRNSYVSGSATWFDLSGNNTTGSLSNVGFDTTKNCLLFSSSSNSTCVFNNSSLLNFNTGSFTIEVVVKLTATASGTVNSLYIKRSTTSGIGTNKGYSYRVLNNTATQAATIISVDNGTGGNNGDYINFGPALNYYTTIQSSLIFDAAALKLIEYKNGIFIASASATTMTGSFYNTNSNLVLGRLEGNSLDAEYYTFRAYNRILSQQEILQNYNAQKSRFNL